MSAEKAGELVDLVAVGLLDADIITPEAFGRIPEDLRESLAAKVAAKSEE